MENLNQSQPVTKTSRAAARKQPLTLSGIIDGFLALISSVPFGISLLVLLVVFSMIGMLIQQQELDTFQNYYTSLTPAERAVYGKLDFFNIYHAWYFNFLLLILSLNIILASIDHFPKAWKSMRKKKLTASPGFTQTMRTRHEPLEMTGLNRSELVERAKVAARSLRYKVTTTEKDGRTTIYAEKGAWNRLGAYAVHISLLTVFTGGLLTSMKSHTGGMWIEPGEKSDQITQNVFNLDQVGQRSLELPFTVECMDIQQKLIDPKKFIDGGNTIDWLSRVKITDKQTGKAEDVLIHLNKPYDFRGYRLFQASFREMGGARTVNLKITPEGGGAAQDVSVRLKGETQLADGSKLRYAEFVPHFELTPQGEPSVGSPQYENPAAHLQIIKPNGEQATVWAFTEAFQKQIEAAPFLKARLSPANSPKMTLVDFEKASQAHMLSIQYDPGSLWFYIGSAMLCTSLIMVFFFSHQRLWIVCEDGKVFMGGDATRNRLAFDDRIRKIAARIKRTEIQTT